MSRDQRLQLFLKRGQICPDYLLIDVIQDHRILFNEGRIGIFLHEELFLEDFRLRSKRNSKPIKV
jgi:hypothetical protein